MTLIGSVCGLWPQRHENYNNNNKDVSELAKIRIQILYFISVGFGFGCRFVTRSQLKYVFDCEVHIK